MMTQDGLIFEANSLKQGRLQALTRQQLQAQATQNRERRWVAPLLMMGCALGALEARALWPLVSMAAALAGTMRLPLTSAIFALELTHDLNALPAMLIASVVSYGLNVLVLKHSILTEKVARRGYSLHPGVRGRSPGAAERRRGDDDRGGDRAGRTPRSRPPQPVLLRRRQIEAFRLPRRGQAREPAGRDHPLGPAGALDHRPDRWVEGCGCAGQWGDHRLRPHQPPVDHRLPLGVVPDRGGADGPNGRETAPRGQP